MKWLRERAGRDAGSKTGKRRCDEPWWPVKKKKKHGSPYEAYGEKTQQAEADAEQVQEYEVLQQTEGADRGDSGRAGVCRQHADVP